MTTSIYVTSAPHAASTLAARIAKLFSKAELRRSIVNVRSQFVSLMLTNHWPSILVSAVPLVKIIKRVDLMGHGRHIQVTASSVKALGN